MMSISETPESIDETEIVNPLDARVYENHTYVVDAAARSHPVTVDYYLEQLYDAFFKANDSKKERFKIVKSKRHIKIFDGKKLVVEQNQTLCDARNLLLELHDADVDYDYEKWIAKRERGGYYSMQFQNMDTPLERK